MIGIAAVLWMVWQFAFQTAVGPPPSPVVALPAERLAFASLAPDEEIVVILISHRRQPVELRFRGQAGGPQLIVSDVVWTESDRAWKMARVRAVRPLAAAEATGLDAVVAHLRAAKGPDRMHAATYEIEHRRNESTVGQETLFQTALVSDWTAEKRFPREAPDARRDLEAAAARAGVSREELERWVTFESLVPPDDPEPDA
ncbi:hypothetical protein [Oleiharenicola sp. Vm1]|uniref:hypothetical protein n=1 Tax=Oleiharenicola sp. Vm1 TaxID=3398393 RepID=UPI0039F45DCF